MTQLIKDGKVTTNDNQTFITLEEFLSSNDKSVGVWLDAGEEIEQLAEFIGNIPVVALNFPTFADGRAYSSAASPWLQRWPSGGYSSAAS